MKDFDTDRRDKRPVKTREERLFLLGGQQFVAVPRVWPDAMIPMDKLTEDETDPTTCRCAHRLHEHPHATSGRCTAEGCKCESFKAKIVKAGSNLEETLAAVDATIEFLIEPEDNAYERFKLARQDRSDPLEVEDLMEVIQWITENETDRPTGRPNGSTPGAAPTGTPSTDGSSSQVTQVASTV